jgi:hypothetical protein
MLCTQVNIIFLMLLWVYIHTGQAEKFAWPRWESNPRLLGMLTFQPAGCGYTLDQSNIKNIIFTWVHNIKILIFIHRLSGIIRGWLPLAPLSPAFITWSLSQWTYLKGVCQLTESNPSQIWARVKCPSHCLVVFVVQWLSTLILTLTLTPLPTYHNPIRLRVLFNFGVCRLNESNPSPSQMSESLFSCLCRFNDLVP